MKIFINFQSIAFLCVLVTMLSNVKAAENEDEAEQLKSSIFVKLLDQQLSGDVADYMNATPEWQLIMEARIRLTIFTYWVNVTKFGVIRIEMLEKRFGELVEQVEEKKAFKRTFVEPNFIKTAESFPIHGFVSQEGEKFLIKSTEEFETENKQFLKFLEVCVAKTDNRMLIQKDE
jgi:hypothetical protein